MNKILRLVDFIIIQCPLNILQQIEIFKAVTNKSRSSFFRYKRFLKDGTYYKKGMKGILKQHKINRLDQILKESYRVEFALNRWMRETGKSRSSFFRLKRFLKNGSYYKKGMKDILKKQKIDHLNQILKEAWNIKRDVKKFKIVAFSLKKWMRETGRSRSSFFRLKRKLN